MTKATPTSPLKIEVEGKVKKLTRRFLGNLFPKNTQEGNELKSYLKGNTEYTFGREFIIGVGFVPKTYSVRQEYFYI